MAQAHTFIVSDESINSYGYVIRTAGIDTTKFAKNPVMFYMHERESGIIGRWDNIRVEGTQLLADAVFDESDPIGRRVMERVEGGFLRSASIGVENVVKEYSNGVQVIVKCELKEISIVDIPANGNAVKLYKKNGKCTYTLADLDAPDDDLRAQIAGLLGLETTATDTEILDALRSALKSPENVDAEIEGAVLRGYIDGGQRGNYRAMALANRGAFDSFIKMQQKEQQTHIATLVNDGVSKGKFIAQDRAIFEHIGGTCGVRTLRRLLDAMHTAIKPTDVIRSGSDRANWGLNEYRKFAPLELRDDPALYARLVEREGKAPESNSSLDYYRRHNPQYLKDNPDFYARLVERENAN
jgi:HK97 family phage prohead protease